MPQLDLFSSLYDSPPSGDQPEERKVVAKKEEKISVVAEAEQAPYSIVELAEEMLGRTENKRPPKRIEISSEKKIEIESISSSYDEASFNKIANDLSSIIDDVDNSVGLTETAKENKTVGNRGRKNPAQSAGKVAGNRSVKAAKSRTTKTADTLKPSSKTTGQVKPLKAGSVIFEDGKITVKIKTKTPVASEAVEVNKVDEVKEKKEKVKKTLQKRGRKSFKEIDSEVDLIEVPDDEVLFQKQYYPISEVAKWFRVNTSLIRFWENEFDILKPKKNRKGDRLFRPEDVKNLQLIYQLLRQRKYTIEGAKEYMKTNKKKADIQLQLTSTLQKFRNFLLDLKANL